MKNGSLPQRNKFFKSAFKNIFLGFEFMHWVNVIVAWNHRVAHSNPDVGVGDAIIACGREKEIGYVHIATVAMYGHRAYPHVWIRVGDPMMLRIAFQLGLKNFFALLPISWKPSSSVSKPVTRHLSPPPILYTLFQNPSSFPRMSFSTKFLQSTPLSTSVTHSSEQK